LRAAVAGSARSIFTAAAARARNEASFFDAEDRVTANHEHCPARDEEQTTTSASDRNSRCH
jgi:hypothetical protein